MNSPKNIANNPTIAQLSNSHLLAKRLVADWQIEADAHQEAISARFSSTVEVPASPKSPKSPNPERRRAQKERVKKEMSTPKTTVTSHRAIPKMLQAASQASADAEREGSEPVSNESSNVRELFFCSVHHDLHHEGHGVSALLKVDGDAHSKFPFVKPLYSVYDNPLRNLQVSAVLVKTFQD